MVGRNQKQQSRAFSDWSRETNTPPTAYGTKSLAAKIKGGDRVGRICLFVLFYYNLLRWSTPPHLWFCPISLPISAPGSPEPHTSNRSWLGMGMGIGSGHTRSLKNSLCLRLIISSLPVARSMSLLGVAKEATPAECATDVLL